MNSNPLPDGRRSSASRRAAFPWTALLPLVALLEVAVAPLAIGAAPGAQPPAATKASAKDAGPRVILVGWDGGDWKLLDPLMKEGKLPNLAAILGKGRSWDLESFEPMISPLIWTSIATGLSPLDHGVADFQELDPKTGARVPISSRSRHAPALWNLASARGITVGVVGWWATWPAEKVNGFLISDRASPVLFDPETFRKSPALTWPEGLADGVRIVGQREGAPGFEEVSKGLAISRADFDAAVAAKKDLQDPITGYQKVLGSTRVYGRTALDLYDRNKPRLLMVYFEGTDEIGHVQARYFPPKLPNISDEDYRKYSGGVAAYYQEADRILGEFAKRAERDGATLLLVSDHGFKWGENRPSFYSSIQFDTAFLWHESPGIMAAAGPAIVPAAKRGKASVFDVAPTVTRLLGLPPDPAFLGKPVTGIQKAPKAPPAVSWAKIAPVIRLAVVSGHEATDKRAAEEFTKKLISLGYLTGSEAAALDARPASERKGTETAGTFQNFGTFLRTRGKVDESIEWYRKALTVNPKSATAWMNLAVALFIKGQWDLSDDAVITAAQNGYNDPEAAIYRRVSSYMQRTKDPKARAQLRAFLKKAIAAFPENDRYRSSLGKILFEDHDCPGAEKIFAAIVEKRAADVEALNLYALTVWCQGRTDQARALFERSLAVDPKQEIVRRGLAELERGGNAPQ